MTMEERGERMQEWEEYNAYDIDEILFYLFPNTNTEEEIEYELDCILND